MTAPTLLVVGSDARRRTTLAGRVAGLGYCVLGEADGSDALERVRALRPDLVILDAQVWECERSFVRATCLEQLAPVLVLTSDPDVVEPAVSAPVMGIMVGPLTELALRANVELALAHWRRRWVDLAKGLLMGRHRGITEARAHRVLNRLSQDSRRATHCTARAILRLYGAL